MLLVLSLVISVTFAAEPTADPLDIESFLKELENEPDNSAMNTNARRNLDPVTPATELPSSHTEAISDNEVDTANRTYDAQFYKEFEEYLRPGVEEYLSKVFKNADPAHYREDIKPKEEIVATETERKPPPIQSSVADANFQQGLEVDFDKKRNPNAHYQPRPILPNRRMFPPKTLMPQTIQPIQLYDKPISEVKADRYPQIIQNEEINQRALPIQPNQEQTASTLQTPNRRRYNIYLADRVANIRMTYLNQFETTTQVVPSAQFLERLLPVNSRNRIIQKRYGGVAGAPMAFYDQQVVKKAIFKQQMAAIQPVQPTPHARFIRFPTPINKPATLRLWGLAQNIQPNLQMERRDSQIYPQPPMYPKLPPSLVSNPQPIKSSTNKQQRIEKFMAFIKKNRALLMQFIANKRQQNAPMGIMSLQAKAKATNDILIDESKYQHAQRSNIWRGNNKPNGTLSILQEKIKKLKAEPGGKKLIQLFKEAFNLKSKQNIALRGAQLFNKNTVVRPTPYGFSSTDNRLQNNDKTENGQILQNDAVIRLLATAEQIITTKPTPTTATTPMLRDKLNPVYEDIIPDGDPLKLTEPTTTPTAEGEAAVMRVRNENLMLKLPYNGQQLDLAPAKGQLIESLRYKGRLCQRNVLNPEGPKYHRNGQQYVRAYEPQPGHDFARTSPPKILIPICCNCCKKSVLGCE